MWIGKGEWDPVKIWFQNRRSKQKKQGKGGCGSEKNGTDEEAEGEDEGSTGDGSRTPMDSETPNDNVGDVSPSCASAWAQAGLPPAIPHTSSIGVPPGSLSAALTPTGTGATLTPLGGSLPPPALPGSHLMQLPNSLASQQFQLAASASGPFAHLANLQQISFEKGYPAQKLEETQAAMYDPYSQTAYYPGYPYGYSHTY
ncbi:unnamed protein product, partial [Mesorhabditis spiculigera]